jgi:orotate phosphoribosyltransferase
MHDYQKAFLDLALRYEVLRFGTFTLKSGRISPYFFNLGRIGTGAGLRALGRAYAGAILAHGVEFDVLFGPAYKGIPLVAATAIALADGSPAGAGRDVPYAYNRKEAKDHGEGGQLVGAQVADQRVLILDDVLTAGTALRDAHARLRAAGAVPVAALIALDRQELGAHGRPATVELAEQLGISVLALVTVRDLLDYLAKRGGMAGTVAAIEDYQKRYGVPA